MNTINSLNSLINYALWGDFGLLTVVPYFLFKILFPIVTSFYLLQFFLLESNLLKIISLKFDKSLNKIGLSSNTLLPLILGFGCVTVALGTLQVINSSREKRIAQILLCMLIPCSAQLVINTVLIFHTGKSYFIAYICTMFLIFLVLSFALNLIFPKEAPIYNNVKKYKLRYYFVLPKILPLIYKSLNSGIKFLIETAIPFAIGNIIVSIIYYLGYVNKLCNLTAPLFQSFLGLPKESATIFILSIIKKDLGAASLLSLFTNGNFSDAQIFVCTIMLTLFVPCFASMIILFKHEKKTVAVLVWFICIFMSLFVGKILSTLLILPLPN